MKNFRTRIQSTKTVTYLYFFLLLYTIAALLWWGLLLYKQSLVITSYEQKNLELQMSKQHQPVEYALQLKKIHDRENLRRQMYLGEGITFLLVILLGAGFVYRSVRKQIKLSQQQQNFMMAVTHELKSPIATAKLNLETLQMRRLTIEQQQKLIGNTIRETSRLNDLCNNILLASQFETHQYHLVKEEFNLSELVEKCIIEIRERIRTHEVEGMVAPDTWMNGDRLMIQIIINNLIENAVKYSPRNGKIAVSLQQEKQQAVLEVADEGEGITEEERKKIFYKFYRIGNENTRKSKGTGLGLFLVKMIIRQHNGEIYVRNNQPKGSIFEIRLPVLKNDILT